LYTNLCNIHKRSPAHAPDWEFERRASFPGIHQDRFELFMGIQGLLPIIKPVCFRRHISDFAQKRVGVDGYSWLHKSLAGCCIALDRSNGTTAPRVERTERFVENFLGRVRMLQHYGVSPLIVFDGGRIPAKSETEKRRATLRAKNLELATQALARGEIELAQSFLQRSIDVTPEMAYEVIKALRKENFDFLVAPYEADAQLAMLSRENLIDLVITEDSDLIVYGARSILFKLDRYGYGDHVEQRSLGAVTNPSLLTFNPDMLLYMCVLAGCDFFAGIPRTGIRRAHALVQKYRKLDKILLAVRSKRLSEDYEAFERGFRKAITAFRYHRVFDPRTRQVVHLNSLPSAMQSDELDGILGPAIEAGIATRIAAADLCPIQKMPFDKGVPVEDVQNSIIEHLPTSRRALSRAGGRVFWEQVQVELMQASARNRPHQSPTQVPLPKKRAAIGVGSRPVSIAVSAEERTTSIPELDVQPGPSTAFHELSVGEVVTFTQSQVSERSVHRGQGPALSEDQPLCSLCSSLNSQPATATHILKEPGTSPSNESRIRFPQETSGSSPLVECTPEASCASAYSPSVASTTSPWRTNSPVVWHETHD